MPRRVTVTYIDPVDSPYSNHATERWATILCCIVVSQADTPTVSAWARASGLSVGAIRTWCRAAGVTVKTSLDFGRLFRAVAHANNEGAWNVLESMDIVDPRTVERLLARGGLTGLCEGPVILPELFIARQNYIRSSRHLGAVKSALETRLRRERNMRLTT
jgi:hypothetical protein